MSFEIIADNMKRNSEIKSLKLQNDEYAVTIFYYGDYAKDIKAGTCPVNNLSMDCKPKGECFPLSCVCGKVVLSIPAISIVPIYEIDALKRKLDISKEAALELQEILNEYFGVMPYLTRE